MKILKYADFIEENYLDDPINPESVKFSHKKMKKNGYLEVEYIGGDIVNTKDVKLLKSGDMVMVDGNELGQLEDDSFVKVLTSDNVETIVSKGDLKIQ